MNLFEKIGFSGKKQVLGFFSVVLSGQIIYSGFEAFKGTFYDLLLEVLKINNTQMGILFTLIGSAIFFYIPAGWINNRFPVKSILITSLLIRFITMMGVIFLSPSFHMLMVIAGIWGLVDSAFWPAVVNGVTLMSGDNNKGMAFGLLESVRRASEMGMNAIIVGIMALLGGSILVFQSAIIIYTLLILPMIFCVWKFVPNNRMEIIKGESKNKEALNGLLHVLKMPTVWLAAITSLTVYWIYITLIYTVPYLQAVFGLSTEQAALFGIINTGAMGVISGLISGSIADFIFKSSIKMMFFALFLTIISLSITIFLPKEQNMLFINIILLMCFSFSIFLAKGIILAPVAEAGVPKSYTGSAMSIGSFAAYSSVFWAYALNGWIIDTYPAIKAYQIIFGIGLIVAIIGMITSFALIIMKKRTNEILVIKHN
ncbi:MFS transporter [Photobacterium kishitanii]|uniref:MFS transporter n=3 Tax=Photobacterium kishitanii TaxID=318456 RepID=A0A0B7J9R0_9GAMM|nr:MFS transporter [Photobacterium kishitanii]KJG06206.1 transporter [Photobacterium kishitanii]OBU26949.1 transporter [Photobacterium kishitanii]OBU30116.1 transporter [Photobacterium kishitanii]PSU20365.1 MFS transporter [Photobacterium kishitanii]PSU89037.1 MFS transporter [Photobacterium kishitanii]